jgi:hypothetical protein
VNVNIHAAEADRLGQPCLFIQRIAFFVNPAFHPGSLDVKVHTENDDTAKSCAQLCNGYV